MIYFILFIVILFNAVVINDMLAVLDAKREHRAIAEMLKVEQEYVDSIKVDM